jgi:hypothetical protein
MFVSSEFDYVNSGIFGAALGTPTLLGAELSQSVPTTPGDTYLLSLWLANPSGNTPNAFQITWNGSALYDQQDITNQSFLNLQFIATASAANSVVLFDFQDDVGNFALDDVVVSNVVLASAVTAPQINGHSLGVAGGQFSFSWTAQMGQSYQVQFATNLANRAWINLGGSQTATSSVMSVSNAISGKQGFYRVVLLP